MKADEVDWGLLTKAVLDEGGTPETELDPEGEHLKKLCTELGGSVEVGLAAHFNKPRTCQAILDARSTKWERVKLHLKEKSGEPMYDAIRYPNLILVRYQMMEAAK